MLPKPFTLKAPVDSVAVPLESFLSLVSARALQSASGTYAGTGKEITVTTPFYPKFVLVSRYLNVNTASATTTGTIAISLASNEGMSWLPTTGFVKDCITGMQNNGFTIGTNAAVNTASTTTTQYVYTYFVIG